MERSQTQRMLVPGRRAASGCAAVVVVEVIGMAFMWAAIPFAWIWVGKRVGDSTGSLMAALSVTFLGFVLSVAITARVLQRIDDVWIELRRRAGHKQVEGALTQVVVVSTTLGLLVFFVWYYILSQAFILPFMPSH